jgi:FMN phosphatase YigB (HAD superfamily)
MVGDSERNDIVPARALGMVTVRVDIEQAVPEVTAATHRCRSLAEVAEVLSAEADGSRCRL